MTRDEFCDYAAEEGCTIDGKIIRNTINGRYTRLDDSFNEESDLQAVHHMCVLGLAPTPELEDLYEVYSPVYWRIVNGLEPLAFSTHGADS